MPSVKQRGIKYHFFFLVFGMAPSEIDPWSIGLLVSTLTIIPMDHYIKGLKFNPKSDVIRKILAVYNNTG